MDYLSERAKLFAKQLRYYWAFLSFVLVFVLILWTFQLALIVRFQTFWPSGRTFCFSSQDVINDEKTIFHTSFEKSSEIIDVEPPLKIICYYVINSNISSSLNGNININPLLCTHINIGFVNVLNGSLVPADQHDHQVYKYMMNLKLINPELKILISVQEYSSSIGEFSKVVSSDIRRKKFTDNVLDFIEKYGFDGIDIDWEFPAWPKADTAQRHNFTLLLKELRSSFNMNFNNSTSIPLLSVAVGAPAAIFLQCYDISDMAKYVDWINLMSYDYHLYSKLTPTTGPNAPLYQRPQDTTFFSTLNTNWSAAHWAFWGMPKNKIIIGIPTYGHSFRLLNSDNNGWYAPAVGIGTLGSEGFITYPDACVFLLRDSTTHVWDDHYKVPYAFQDSEWISYESVNSVKHKAELVREEGYGGAMVFSLNTDDTEGVCKQGSFPLTSVVHLTLQSSRLYQSNRS